jgi:hypothetical protein
VNDEELIKLGLVHSLHTSERRSFRSCRRRWNWAYRQYYYPRVTPTPLEFGVAFHRAMEVWYDPTFWDHPEHDEVQVMVAKSEFNRIVKEQKAKYRKLNGPLSQELEDDYRARVQLGIEMIDYYTTKVSPILDIGFKPLAVEIPFEVPLGFRCTCDKCWERFCAHSSSKPWLDTVMITRDGVERTRRDIGKTEAWQGLPVCYGGRCDMIAQDDYGRLWIFDWKTTSRMLDESAEASFLELDDQISSYVAALHKLGRPVAGFVYHEQKKAIPKPPEALARRAGGRLYSISQSANTTYPVFKATVAQFDPIGLDTGLYDDYMHWLRTDGPRFHQRHQIPQTSAQIENTWNNLIAEAHDILENPRIYPQPGRFSCTSCLYRQPCLGMNMDEDYQYTLDSLFERREKHYYEETPASTE